MGYEGETILCISDRAPLYVLLGAERFSDLWIGENQGHTPNDDLRRQYELEFSLLHGLVKDSVKEELLVGATRPVAVRSSRQFGGEQPLIDRPADRPHNE